MEYSFTIRLVLTAALFALAFALRIAIARVIRGGASVLHERQRRNLFYLRSALTLLVIVGLLAIWLGHLQNLILSLTAVLVAVVLATKELLMCISGFVLRATGRLFAVGDWIDCNGMRGEVTDHTLLSTTVLEMDPPEHGYRYTGRRLIVPNSMFLTHPVKTSSLARRYVLHRASITLETQVEPDKAIAWLQRRIQELSSSFVEEAGTHLRRVNHDLGLELASTEPQVTVATTDLGKLRFQVQFVCPVRQAALIESQLTDGFLQALFAGEIPAPAAAPAPA